MTLRDRKLIAINSKESEWVFISLGVKPNSSILVAERVVIPLIISAYSD